MAKTITRSEDAGTADLVRKARAAVACGREILVPATVVDRLARENVFRALRKQQIRSAAFFLRRSRKRGNR